MLVDMFETSRLTVVLRGRRCTSMAKSQIRQKMATDCALAFDIQQYLTSDV